LTPQQEMDLYDTLMKLRRETGEPALDIFAARRIVELVEAAILAAEIEALEWAADKCLGSCRFVGITYCHSECCELIRAEIERRKGGKA